MIEPADIAVELKRAVPSDGSPELAQWVSWIADARMLISLGDGTHVGLGSLTALDQATLDYVTRKAVAAHVRRPDDATTVEVAVDDGRVSRRYTSGKGEIEIADRWWAMLSPATDDSGAFSVRPYGEPDPVPCW